MSLRCYLFGLDCGGMTFWACGFSNRPYPADLTLSNANTRRHMYESGAEKGFASLNTITLRASQMRVTPHALLPTHDKGLNCENVIGEKMIYDCDTDRKSRADKQII